MIGKHRGRNGAEVIESKELYSWLAKYLIQRQAGERLRGVRDLAASAGTSVGSISSALNYLESVGAVKVERHGHAGSTIVECSIGKLWRIAEGAPLVIAWTLPTHLRFEALATGFKRVLTQMDISTYLIFVRGAQARLELLRENKCHAAIMSSHSASEMCGPDEEALLKLPPGSWILSNCVYYRTGQSQRARLRVAVDQTSFDQTQWTILEFEGQDVELVPVSYWQMPRLLKNGYVDAALASLDQSDAFLSSDVTYRRPSDRVLKLVGAEGEAATLVGLKTVSTVRAVVEALDVDQILDIQRKVLASEIIPEY